MDKTACFFYEKKKQKKSSSLSWSMNFFLKYDRCNSCFTCIMQVMSIPNLNTSGSNCKLQRGRNVFGRNTE
jgi:hypothetical protein